jgi:hypothetical protein
MSPFPAAASEFIFFLSSTILFELFNSLLFRRLLAALLPGMLSVLSVIFTSGLIELSEACFDKDKFDFRFRFVCVPAILAVSALPSIFLLSFLFPFLSSAEFGEILESAESVIIAGLISFLLAPAVPLSLKVLFPPEKIILTTGILSRFFIAG